MKMMFYRACAFHQDLSNWKIHPNCVKTDWLKGTLLDYYESRREDTIATTKQFKEELVATAWDPKRVVEWCFDGESKEEIGKLIGSLCCFKPHYFNGI
jgi:hypothetical protein